MYLLPNDVVADDHCYLSDTTNTQRAHTKHDTPNDKITANDDATLWKLQPEPEQHSTDQSNDILVYAEWRTGTNRTNS